MDEVKDVIVTNEESAVAIEKEEVKKITKKRDTTKESDATILSIGVYEVDIMFKGFGITLPKPEGFSGKVRQNIVVKYSGQIGLPNFKIELPV